MSDGWTSNVSCGVGNPCTIPDTCCSGYTSQIYKRSTDSLYSSYGKCGNGIYHCSSSYAQKDLCGPCLFKDSPNDCYRVDQYDSAKNNCSKQINEAVFPSNDACGVGKPCTKPNECCSGNGSNIGKCGLNSNYCNYDTQRDLCGPCVKDDIDNITKCFSTPDPYTHAYFRCKKQVDELKVIRGCQFTEWLPCSSPYKAQYRTIKKKRLGWW